MFHKPRAYPCGFSRKRGPCSLPTAARDRTTIRAYTPPVTSFIPEEVDLAELRRRLEKRFADMPPVGYVEGKTALRAAVVDVLQCSEVEAEQLVDTLEARGLIRYAGDRSEEVDSLRKRWSLRSAT